MTRWFRKHSKILMVLLTVFAMVVFVFGDAILQLTRPGGADRGEFKDEVVATWGNDQEIKQSDLSLLLARHFQVQRFLEAIVKAAQAAKADYRPLAALIPPIQGDERASRGFINEQLVERFILARKAEKEGLVYTDAMVDEYLNSLSGQVGFSKAQLTELNREANSNQASLEVVRRHLRQELLAQQMRLLTLTGFQTVANPTEGAELFQQYSEMVQCDVMPVSVDQFSNLTETPSAADLQQIYEKGKFEYPDPSGKRPGFKLPNRVAVQYIMADFETFMQNEMNKLTAQQVQEEYDRLVAAKDNLVMEEVPAAEPEKKPENPATPAPVASGEASETETQPAPKPESGGDPQPKPEAERKPADGDNSATPPPAPAETKGEKKDGQSLRRAHAIGSSFQYVSLQQDSEAETSTDESTKQQPSSEASSDSGKEQAAEKPAENKNAGQSEQLSQDSEGSKPDQALPSEPAKPTVDPSVNQETEGTASKPAQTDAAPADPQESGIEFAEDKKPELRPRPLVDVSDKIKRKLVAETVAANIEKAVKTAEEELEMHQTDLMAWEQNLPETRGKQPEFDYQEISKRLGLVAAETELVDFQVFEQTSIGKALVRSNQFSFGTLAQRIFGDYDRMNKFAYERQTDLMTNNQYLYWLTEKADAESVPFEECKEEVEKYWKQNRMLEEALKKTRGIAAEINNSNAKLKEKYGQTVTSTGEFSWFNTGGQVTLGQPQGVTNPGDDFMKSVFALSTNQCGVAVNADRTVVYVVQMMSERKELGKLGTEYVENQFLGKKSIPGEVEQVILRYAQGYNLDYNQELLDEMGLKFLRQ